MSNWKIVVPEATTNYCLNPSAETTGNFTDAGGSTVTRVTTYQKYGLYSYRVETAGNNEGAEFTLSALSNAIHYVTMRVVGTLPTAWDWSLDDATYNTPALIEDIDGTWSLYGFEFPAAQANGSTTLYVDQSGAGSGDFYLDGIQVEQKDDYYTTFCDGTQDGCEWNGAENASTSSRDALSRAGGRVKDLQDDYGLYIGGVIGTGVTSLDIGVDEYALLPGGELNSIKEKYRVFTITGTLMGTSAANLHSLRQALVTVLSKDAVPQDEKGYQPVRLRYTGAAVQKEISVHYDDGLKVDIQADQPIDCSERIALSFLADDPYWYEIGNSAAVLDTEDSATFRLVVARLKATGQWDALGPPNAAGTYTYIQTLAEDDTYIYIGGDFTNFDNIANADYIARYNKSTGDWSALDIGTNNRVNALHIAPDGTLYAGGEFTTAGGGVVNRIAAWDGSSWSDLDSGVNNIVYSISIAPDGTLYAGGIFTTAGAGATTVNYIAAWDGSSWSDLNGGVTAIGTDRVYDIEVSDANNVYVVGQFDTAGATSAANIAYWNGTSWAALGSGIDNIGLAIKIAPDSSIYVSGFFSTAGDIAAKRLAQWNGYTWSRIDADLASIGSAINQFIIGPSNPINNIYDIYAGGGLSGTGYFAGLVSVNNNGARAFPKINYFRSGGTSATIISLRNETNGDILFCNYNLVDGETLIIDLSPKAQNITSSYFGSRSDAVLANSDLGAFSLLPGANSITSFVDNDSATITAWMQWRTAYASWD